MAAEYGLIRVVEYFDDSYDISFGVGKGGNRELLDRIIEKDLYVSEYVAFGAAESGHSEIVREMISSDMDEDDLSHIAKHAVMEGNLDIMEEMINGVKANFWQVIAEGAAYSGNKELMEVMIERVKEDGALLSYKDIVCSAAEGGQLHVVMIMLEKIDIDTAILGYIARNAVIGGHLSIVKKIIELGISNIQSLMITAVLKGQIEIIDYLVREYDCVGKPILYYKK